MTDVAEPSPPKPRVWTVVVAIVVSVVAAVLSIAISGASVLGLELARGKTIDQAQVGALAIAQTPLFLALTSAFGSTLIGLVAVFAARFSKVPTRERLRLAASGLDALTVALWAVAVVGLSVSLDAFVGVLRPAPSELAKTSAVMFHAANMGDFVLLLVSVGVFAPVAEELLFRGYVQSRLTARWGVGGAIGITAIVFGAYHADLVHGACAAALGVLLGVIAERTKSIRVTTVAHVTNNALALVIAKIASPDATPSRTEHAVTLAIALVIFAGSAFAAHRRTPHIA